MSWNRDWEKAPDNHDTRIFREKIPPSSPETLRRKEGIFEQRMDGKEFKKLVIERISEAAVYNSEIGRRKNERPIALNIASKLVENEIWQKNATSSREGREAIRILLGCIARNYVEHGELDQRDRATYDKLHSVIKQYDIEIINENKINRERNFNTFVQNFQKLSGQIKKHLESEGYEVGEVYYRDFTRHQLELRAKTTKHIEIDQDTYGYRGDSHVKNIRTERKEVSIGGIDLVSGVFLDAPYFNKHGTAETDWFTQLAFGEVAVLAGVGVRALVSGTRSILLRGSERTANVAAENLARREIQDTVQDIANISMRRGNTLRGVGPQRRGTSIKSSDDDVDTFSSSGLNNRPSRPSRSLELSKTDFDKYGGGAVKTRRENIDELGDDAYEKVTRMGMDDFKLGAYIDDVQKREIKLTGKWGELDIIRQKIVNQIEQTWSLGESNATKLIRYGFEPRDVSNYMNNLAAKGLSRDKILGSVEHKIKLMDYYRNTYCKGDFDQAGADLVDNLGAGGGVRQNFENRIWQKLWEAWKASDPRKLHFDYLRSKMRNDKMAELSLEAKEIVKGIEKSVIGASPLGATLPLIKYSGEYKIETDSQQKIREKNVDKKQQLPKIRDRRQKIYDARAREEAKMRPRLS
jgi:hypothetical protein